VVDRITSNTGNTSCNLYRVVMAWKYVSVKYFLVMNVIEKTDVMREFDLYPHSRIVRSFSGNEISIWRIFKFFIDRLLGRWGSTKIYVYFMVTLFLQCIFFFMFLQIWLLQFENLECYFSVRFLIAEKLLFWEYF